MGELGSWNQQLIGDFFPRITLVTEGLSQPLPEWLVLQLLLVSLAEVKVRHLDRESVPVVGAEGDTGDDDDNHEDAGDDGDDHDADGALAGHVVHGDGDDLDVTGHLVGDHHQEVVSVTLPEIPDDGELALSLEEARRIGRVTGLVTFIKSDDRLEQLNQKRSFKGKVLQEIRSTAPESDTTLRMVVWFTRDVVSPLQFVDAVEPGRGARAVDVEVHELAMLEERLPRNRHVGNRRLGDNLEKMD